VEYSPGNKHKRLLISFTHIKTLIENLGQQKERPYTQIRTGKNGFVTATKLGTTNTFFVAATRNSAAATKRFVDGTKHFVVVTKYFCYPYYNK